MQQQQQQQQPKEAPVVETRVGRVRGVVQRSILGDYYQAFKGIPYAKPPLGKLRYRDPEPVEEWMGIRDATSHGPMAAQCDFFTGSIEGSEDCLYLNVYTSNSKPSKKLPVMIWIHGGGFLVGDATEERYGPDYFMSKGIVLVTISYRLGVLGFLNLEDEVAPGNQGLKDQVLALKWVRDNVAGFGGDRDNITIFGESAGSAAVHYLTISPLAKGLFHKAICQSGVVLNPWTHITSDPKRYAYQMCELLGSKARDPKKAVEFLRTVDAKRLMEIQNQLMIDQEKIKFIFPFGPGVDDKSENPFMPIHPEKAAEEGIQVPLLIGYNSREGILFMEFSRGQQVLPTAKGDFEKFLHPNILQELVKKYKLEPDDLRRLYFKNEDVTSDNFDNLIDFMGDVHFVEGIHRAVKIQVEKSCAPTYLYQYTYDRTVSPFKTLLKAAHLRGANHADEMQHQFRTKMNEPQFEPWKNPSELRIIHQMIELWVNFASTGRPTPTKSELVPFYWKPVASETNFRYLNIDEDLRMETVQNLELRYTTPDFQRNV